MLQYLPRFIQKLFVTRTGYIDLAQTLITAQSHYDIRDLDKHEITHLFLNTTRLLDALLVEMEERGIDTDQLFEVVKNRMEHLPFNNADADKL